MRVKGTRGTVQEGVGWGGGGVKGAGTAVKAHKGEALIQSM